MISHSLRKLEFPSIIARLREEAVTSPGKKLAEKLVPAGSLSSAKFALQETDDALEHLFKHGDLPFGGISDIRPQTSRAANGAILNAGELMQIAALLRAVSTMRESIPDQWYSEKSAAADGGAAINHAVYSRLEQLTPADDLLREIDNAIAGEDELYDHASPALFSIRRRIRDAQGSVRTELDKLLRKYSASLQESLITVRSDRFVLPVKSEHRSDVPGLIHDRSASGSTVFIEPMSVVQLNNKIRELAAEERHEIERILAELSAFVAENEVALLQNIQLLGELDFAMAKAKLSLEMRASAPKLNDEGRIILQQARHPLIPKDQVVPIDFELGVDYTSLLISGPNTGGKTVSLKTCGLLCLMAMAGLHIPARSPSEVAFFDLVLADIGDEQSIEQNLSTFSSHMKEIIRITEVAGPGSLVLLDELGAGTDPSEGAALAIAILDALNKAGCHTVATSHYSELKNYAMNTDGFENASCEFDLESLQPTYKLLIGIPGVSHAFAISQKLGLSRTIIENARELVSEEDTRFQELLSAIENSQKEINEKEYELTKLETELSALRENLETEKNRLKREENERRQQAEAEALSLVAETRSKMEDLLESMAAASKAKRFDHRQESELRGKLTAAEKALLSGHSRSDTQISAEDIVPGGRYEAIDLGISGVVKSPPDNKGQVILESGQISFSVDSSRLRALSDNSDAKSRVKGIVHKRRNKETPHQFSVERKLHATTEIMLRGMRAEEALQALDHFVDDSYLSSISPIRIIHGKGSGVLRQVCHEYLSRDPRIKSFRLGGEGEGGDGVTVAELKL